MIAPDHPLFQIAHALRTNLKQARDYCRAVQNACHQNPSFASIAKAVEEFGSESLDISVIAERASVIHGLGAENVSAQVETSTFLPHAAPVRETVQADQGIRTKAISFVDEVVGRLFDHLLAEPVEGKVVGFAGSGPYRQDDLERLTLKLGGTPDQIGIEWEQVDWIVLGTSDIDREHLQEAVDKSKADYLTQEEFLGLIFFGEDSVLKQGERIPYSSHPGVVLVNEMIAQRKAAGGEVGDSVTLPEPDFPGSIEQSESRLDLNVQSELRRLGYTVAKGVSLEHRRAALAHGVSVLGIKRVVSHVAWLMRFHRKNPRRVAAVSNWGSDLDWLRAEYDLELSQLYT